MPDAAAAVDAEVDAGPPVCTLAQEGEACDAMDRCCSGHCREDKKCVTSCAAAGKSCDLLDTKACCVGFFCNGTLFSAHCVGCIASGDAPLKDVFGAARLNSCCSRTTNATGDKCQ